MQKVKNYGNFTLGQIAQPYIPKEYKYNLFSKSGIKERTKEWYRKISSLKSKIQISILMKPRFKKSSFLETVAKPIYLKVHDSIEKKDYSTLTELTTSFGFFKNRQLMKEVQPKIESIENIKIYHYCSIPIVEISKRICQITVELSLKKRDTNNEIIQSKEYVVFEKNVKEKSSQWKYVGKIDTTQPIRFPSKKDLLNF